MGVVVSQFPIRLCPHSNTSHFPNIAIVIFCVMALPLCLALAFIFHFRARESPSQQLIGARNRTLWAKAGPRGKCNLRQAVQAILNKKKRLHEAHSTKKWGIHLFKKNKNKHRYGFVSTGFLLYRKDIVHCLMNTSYKRLINISLRQVLCYANIV